MTYEWWLLYVHVYMMVRALLCACMLESSCVCVCVRAHVCGGMRAWVHFPVCACVCICKCVCVHACAHLCVHVCCFVCGLCYVCVCQCVYIVYVCVGEGVVSLCVLPASIHESGFACVCVMCVCVCVCACEDVCVLCARCVGVAWIGRCVYL